MNELQQKEIDAREAALENYLHNCDHEFDSLTYRGPMSVCDVCRGRFSEESFEFGWDAAKEFYQPKWVSISDSVPELFQSVLLTWARGADRFVEEGSINQDEKWQTVRTNGQDEPIILDDEGEVIAWTPLPEPFHQPQGEQKQK